MPDDRKNPHNIALDKDGSDMAFSSEQVHAVTARAAEIGRMLVAVIELPNGDIAVQVMEPEPREDLADALDAAARGYRAALERKDRQT